MINYPKDEYCKPEPDYNDEYIEMTHCKGCDDEFEYDEIEWGLCADCREELLDNEQALWDFIYNCSEEITNNFYCWYLQLYTNTKVGNTGQDLVDSDFAKLCQSERYKVMTEFICNNEDLYYEWCIKEKYI